MTHTLTFKPSRKNHWIAKPDMLYSYRIEKQGYKYIATYGHVYLQSRKPLGEYFAFILAKNACLAHRKQLKSC